jgi:kinesin family protein 3/17
VDLVPSCFIDPTYSSMLPGNIRLTIAHEDRACIEIHSPCLPESVKTFTFDAVFSDKATQRNVYDISAAPVVESVLMGYNGTVFVYGQTGSGKVRL